MKLKNIFVAGLAASLALVACNKEASGPEEAGDQALKSVTVNLANLVTKSVSDPITGVSDNATPVKVNSVQVFFSDGVNLYDGYTLTAGEKAQTYFSDFSKFTTAREDSSDDDKSNVFHYIDGKVNKVIIVGNKEEITFGESEAKTEARLEEKLGIDNEQDINALSIYGETTTLEKDGEDVHGTNYYKAAVTVFPRVSRIQIKNFTYLGAEEGSTDATPKYNEIKVTQVAFNNYYSETGLTGGTLLNNEVTNAYSDVTGEDNFKSLENATVWTYFDGLINKSDAVKTAENGTSNESYVWYTDFEKDASNNLTAMFTCEAPTFDTAGNKITSSAPSTGTANLAYNFFPAEDVINGVHYPQLVVRLIGVPNPNHSAYEGIANPQEETLYLATLKFKANGSGVFSGKVAQVYDVDFSFDDSNLANPIKCIEVSVEPVNWTVIPVTPEF